MMKVAICGAGAVGIGLASALARPGERLALLGRDPATRDALAQNGVLRTGLLGDQQVPPDQIEVLSQPSSLTENPPDWLLICTKAFSGAGIARDLAPIADALSPKTRLVLCQNGWGNEKPFSEFWPPESLFHARVITGFHRRGRNEVEITAHAAPLALGSVTGHPIGSLDALAARLSEGGFPTETRSDMPAVLWAKMLYNCALNPLGALVGERYGALTENPSTRSIVEEVIREIFPILDVAGVRLPWANADAYLETFHQELIPPTAQHESSMLQDLRAGRRTEIESLCGAVESLAEAHQLKSPVVSALATLVRLAEAKHEPESGNSRLGKKS